MAKKLLLLFIVFISLKASAQKDFIVLKKNDRVIATYFTGLVFNFQLTNKQWMTGYLRKIGDDTLVIKPFVLHIVPGLFGMPMQDTTYLPDMKLTVANIYAVPRLKNSFGYIKDGTLFQIGGGGYMALNVVNNLADKQPLFSADNSRRLGIAAGVLAIGTVLHITRKSYLKLGKKYTLEYVALNGSS